MQPLTDSDIRRRLKMMDRGALETTAARLAVLVSPETTGSILDEISEAGGQSYLDGVRVRTLETLEGLEGSDHDFDDEDVGDLFYCDVLDALSREFSKELDDAFTDEEMVLVMDIVFEIVSAMRDAEPEDDRVRTGFEFAAAVILDNAAYGRLDDLFNPI